MNIEHRNRKEKRFCSYAGSNFASIVGSVFGFGGRSNQNESARVMKCMEMGGNEKSQTCQENARTEMKKKFQINNL